MVAAVDVLPVGDSATSHAVGGTGDRPELELIDCVGLDREGAIPKLTGMAAACDLIVWVVAANDGARDLDRRLIDAIGAYFAANPRQKAPPLLIALSHIDRLRPFTEWEPPYDIAAPAGRKAKMIRGAVDATAEALGVSAGRHRPGAAGRGGALQHRRAVGRHCRRGCPKPARAAYPPASAGGKGRRSIAEVARQALKGGRLLSGLVIDGIAGKK